MKSNMKQTIFIVVFLVRTVLTELQFEYVERKDMRRNKGILLEMVAQPIIVEESLWLKSKVSLADMENLLAESYDLHSNLKDVCDNIHDFLLDRRGGYRKGINPKRSANFQNSTTSKLPQLPPIDASWQEHMVWGLHHTIGKRTTRRQDSSEHELMTQTCFDTHNTLLNSYDLSVTKLFSILEMNLITPVDGILGQMQRFMTIDFEKFEGYERSKRSAFLLKQLTRHLIKSKLTSRTTRMLRKIGVGKKSPEKAKLLAKGSDKLLSVGLPLMSANNAHRVDRRWEVLEEAARKGSQLLNETAHDVPTTKLFAEQQYAPTHALNADIGLLASGLNESSKNLSLTSRIFIHLENIKEKAALINQHLTFSLMELSQMLQTAQLGKVPYVVDRQIASFLTHQRSRYPFFTPHPDHTIVIMPEYAGGFLTFMVNILLSAEVPWEMWRVIPIPIPARGRLYTRQLSYTYALTRPGEKEYIPLSDPEEIQACKQGICLHTSGPSYPMGNDHCGIGLIFENTNEAEKLDKCDYVEETQPFFIKQVKGGLVYSSTKSFKARLHCKGAGINKGVGPDGETTIVPGSAFFDLPVGCDLTLNDAPRFTFRGQPRLTEADAGVAQQHLHAVRGSVRGETNGEVQNKVLERVEELRKNHRDQLVIAIDTDLHDKLDTAMEKRYPRWARILFAVIIAVTILLSVVGALYLVYCYYRDSWLGKLVRFFNRLLKRSRKSHDEGCGLWNELLELMSNPKEWAAYIGSAGDQARDRIKQCSIANKLSKLRRRLRKYKKLAHKDSEGEESDGEGQELRMESLRDLLRKKLLGIPCRCCKGSEVEETQNQENIYEEVPSEDEAEISEQEGNPVASGLKESPPVPRDRKVKLHRMRCLSSIPTEYELDELPRSEYEPTC